jgi:hypothetical protein
MSKLIATTQATVDGVVHPVGEWVDPDGDHGEYSFGRQAKSSGLVLGRKTFEGLAGVWGRGNVHVLGDRGTVRMKLDDVKRFDSGVVLLTYLPAS